MRILGRILQGPVEMDMVADVGTIAVQTCRDTAKQLIDVGLLTRADDGRFHLTSAGASNVASLVE